MSRRDASPPEAETDGDATALEKVDTLMSHVEVDGLGTIAAPTTQLDRDAIGDVQHEFNAILV